MEPFSEKPVTTNRQTSNGWLSKYGRTDGRIHLRRYRLNKVEKYYQDPFGLETRSKNFPSNLKCLSNQYLAVRQNCARYHTSQDVETMILIQCETKSKFRAIQLYDNRSRCNVVFQPMQCIILTSKNLTSKLQKTQQITNIYQEQ